MGKKYKTSQKPNPLSRHLSWIFPLIIIAILLTIFYALFHYSKGRLGNEKEDISASSPTKSPARVKQTLPSLGNTDNWLLYQGKGYSIQYPPDFEIETTTTASSPNYPTPGDVTLFRSSSQVITITTALKPEDLTIDNALGSGPSLRYVREYLEGKTIEEYLIDGKIGFGVEDIAAGQEGTALDVVWLEYNVIFQLTTADAEAVEIAKEMLATFRLTH